MAQSSLTSVAIVIARSNIDLHAVHLVLRGVCGI